MTEKTLYGLIGAGGFGREVMPLLRKQVEELAVPGAAEIVFVVEDVFSDQTPSTINGSMVMSLSRFLEFSGTRYFNIAIADAKTRHRIATKCLESGVKSVDIYANNWPLFDETEIGPGAILCPFTIITSNVRIGKFFHANFFSYIAHDCIIGDFVTIAPKAACLGNVHVEDHAYIGAGAIIKQGHKNHPVTIGRGAIIGMGAIVTRDVLPGQTVIGNPARPITESHLHQNKEP